MQTVPYLITAAFFLTLLAVAIVDQKTMEIPDFFHGIILALAVIDMVFCCFTKAAPVALVSRVIGLFCVSVPMLLLCYVVDGAFGGGDIKLMGACGLFLGWKLTLLAMFFGVVFGGIWGIFLLLSKNAERKDHFAFGPFLCAGVMVSVLWGEALLNAYLSLLI